jgi:hypothetical protein
MPSTFGDSLSQTFVAFIFNHISNFETCHLTIECYPWIEKGAFTPKAPRWKVDGRQSSSVSVLLPTGARKGDREAGIDSTAEFPGLMPFGHPRFETPRSAPAPQAFLSVFLQGLAMAISFLTTAPQPKCAYARCNHNDDENWL